MAHEGKKSQVMYFQNEAILNESSNQMKEIEQESKSAPADRNACILFARVVFL